MRALLHDPAVLHHEDRVRVPDRREPVRDHEARPPAHQARHRALDQELGPGVDRARRLVQDEDGRIAEERGWTIGREVGWHIRFERNFARGTSLLVVTEGILTAYLQGDPLLSDVTTLIIDEFHERSVHADLGLAMAKQAWLDHPGADGLLMVGGGAPIYEVIEAIETDIGKPVVAANYAGLWSALTLASVRTPIRGFGKLLTCF